MSMLHDIPETFQTVMNKGQKDREDIRVIHNNVSDHDVMYANG